MAKIWSVSQNKFIDSGGSTQNSVMSAQAGESPQNTAVQNLMKMAALKSANNPSEYKTVLDMFTTPKLTAAEIATQQSKTNADRIITQMEDFYFKNKLYYGNNAKGIFANTVGPMLDPNSPSAQYKAFIESNGAFLAKAAGDSGNIALQEQLLSRKPFPTTRFQKKTAITNFTEIRKKFGLPERDYNSLTDTSANSQMGLQSLGVQFGGK